MGAGRAVKRTISDFEVEFQKMKPLVIERSKGICEAAEFVRSLMRQSDGGALIVITLAAESMMQHHRCAGRVMHVHHRKYRSRGGGNSLDNLLGLCEPCHYWAHSESVMSNLLGITLHTNQSEEL